MRVGKVRSTVPTRNALMSRTRGHASLCPPTSHIHRLFRTPEIPLSSAECRQHLLVLAAGGWPSTTRPCTW